MQSHVRTNLYHFSSCSNIGRHGFAFRPCGTRSFLQGQIAGARRTGAVQLTRAALPGNSPVPLSEALVRDAVDDEVQAGVDVSRERGEQVSQHWVSVILVQDDHQQVRRPAQAERDEDDDDDPRLLHRLLERSRCLVGVELGPTDVGNYGQVEGEHRHQQGHEAGHDEHGVAVGGSIPEALVDLVVKVVPAPADVTGGVHEGAYHPRYGTHQAAVTSRVDPSVDRVMADIDIAADADQTDVGQRDDAAYEAGTSQGLTKPVFIVEENRTSQCLPSTITALISVIDHIRGVLTKTYTIISQKWRDGRIPNLNSKVD